MSIISTIILVLENIEIYLNYGKEIMSADNIK